MKRRDFLAFTTTATAALPVLAGHSEWGGRGRTNLNGISHAIFDERFTNSIVFGRTMRDMGCSVSSFHGDVTQLWSGYLDLQWRLTSETTAGQTTKECFFCLAQLSAGHGMYPKLWIEHSLHADGTISHEINGPIDRQSAATADLADSINWSQRAAELLISLDLSSSTHKGNHSTPHCSVLNSCPETSLMSWVMMPTRQTQLLKHL